MLACTKVALIDEQISLLNGLIDKFQAADYYAQEFIIYSKRCSSALREPAAKVSEFIRKMSFVLIGLEPLISLEKSSFETS